jgi:phosphoserine phosphatase RsbU/P
VERTEPLVRNAAGANEHERVWRRESKNRRRCLERFAGKLSASGAGVVERRLAKPTGRIGRERPGLPSKSGQGAGVVRTMSSETNATSRIRVDSQQLPSQRMACMEIWGGNSLVETNVELPGLRGWIHSQPLAPATKGGDVYYLSVCSQGMLSRIVLADVAGHGQEVSAMAVRLRDLLRQHVNAYDQSELMRGINEAFEQCQHEAGDYLQYATAAVLGYYCAERQLIFANAGHPPILWHRALRKKWELLTDSSPENETYIEGLPLGMIPGTDYVQTAVRLDEGDTLVLYTDGVTECMDAQGKELGSEGLLELAKNGVASEPEAMGKRLLDALQEYRADNSCGDDLSVVVLQVVAA